MPKSAPRAYLVFSGSGPMLLLSTFPKLTDERPVQKLLDRGIEKFMAYQVDLDAVEARYAKTYSQILEEIQDREDVWVVDFNGHRIMANFSLDALGDPIKLGG